MADNEDNSGFLREYISLKINDNDSGLSPMSFSLTEFDSIYQFYPKAKLVVSDYEGLLNEYMGFIDGTTIEVTLGRTKEESKKCKFVIAKNAVPQQRTSSNGTGGDIEIELIHDYFNQQYKKSVAYQNNISDIIKSLVRKYRFDKTDIEDTLNSGFWYQPFINDSEFIVDYLLPFAFNNATQNTPFYAFIDTNNVFHFKSFYSMFESTPLKELTYGTLGTDIIANDKILSSVNFSQLELSKLKPFYNCNYYSYDKNGEFSEFTDKMTDYTKTQGKYPIIGESNNTTNIIPLYDEDLNADDTKNNNRGYRINLHKEIVLPDKIIINTVLDKSLVCGNTVTINLPQPDSNADSSLSLRNSGKYLIESSYHSWNAQSARTVLVCSKQNLKLPNKDYRIANMLFN